MAHRRRSGFQKTIDYKTWSTVLHGQIATLDLSEGAVAAGDVSGSFTDSQTILRTRGKVLMELNTSAVNERVTVAVGLIIVSIRAASAGVGSLPLPVDNGEDDWLWHDFLQVTSGQEAAIIDSYLVDRIVLDSKAMRKVRIDEAVVFMAQVADSVDQGGNVSLMYATRMLFGT